MLYIRRTRVRSSRIGHTSYTPHHISWGERVRRRVCDTLHRFAYSRYCYYCRCTIHRIKLAVHVRERECEYECMLPSYSFYVCSMRMILSFFMTFNMSVPSRARVNRKYHVLMIFRLWCWLHFLLSSQLTLSTPHSLSPLSLSLSLISPFFSLSLPCSLHRVFSFSPFHSPLSAYLPSLLSALECLNAILKLARISPDTAAYLNVAQMTTCIYFRVIHIFPLRRQQK